MSRSGRPSVPSRAHLDVSCERAPAGPKLLKTAFSRDTCDSAGREPP